MPAKRKSRKGESLEELELKTKKERRREMMNMPANEPLKACLNFEALKIPALKIIDLNSCMQNYLSL